VIAASPEIQHHIEALFDEKPAAYDKDTRRVFKDFLKLLNTGQVRSAEPDSGQPTGWRVNTWVKKGILLGFRLGKLIDMTVTVGGPQFFDKSTYPLKHFSLHEEVRIVPGGSSIRTGCFVGRGVTCMPPMYINVGAYVDTGTMIDSHALVGSCAQIGKRCHISAASQIGGVLEPVGALPVIVEDDVLVGGNCGIYEGTVLKSGVVLGSGTILNRSTPVYDLVRETIYRATDGQPLVIPKEAVVVPGSRPIQHGPGKDWGLSLSTPVIVKYRDSITGAKIQLEDLLR
jgi:2,3,4,5-tetrahydropyridine-2,6-dicarboxylate N-succinyltransferase